MNGARGDLIGSGWSFPVRLTPGGSVQLFSGSEEIDAAIRMILTTAPGERVMRPDFGSGLLQMVFAPNSPEIATTIQYTLQAALQKWLGDVIAVRQLSVAAVDSTLTVSLSYLVRATSQLENATFTRSL